MTQTAGTAAEQAMETLTAQWFNAVTTGCRLDPSTFQLAQGFPVLGTTSEALWQVFDALPPRSLAHYWNPGRVSSFARTYGTTVSVIAPPAEVPFAQAMGDYYAEWNAYKRTLTPDQIRDGILAVFKLWSELNMPTGQALQAYKILAGMISSPVIVAQEMWIAANGNSPGAVFAYDTTNEAFQLQVESAPGPVEFTMNSATMSSDVSHTWASGRVGGMLDFFSASASGSYDRLTSQITTAGVDVKTTIRHLLTLTVGPLATPERGYLSRYAPWYDSAALGLAFQNRQDEFWPLQPPNWQQVFGPEGLLQSVTGSLVLASGMTTTITSATAFSDEDRTAVRAAAEFGIFPFFAAEASGGWTHDVSFKDEGAMTVTSTVPGNETVVLGAIVTPIASMLGGRS